VHTHVHIRVHVVDASSLQDSVSLRILYSRDDFVRFVVCTYHSCWTCEGAVCCNVLQCVVVSCGMLQCAPVCVDMCCVDMFLTTQQRHGSCSALQLVAVYFDVSSILQQQHDNARVETSVAYVAHARAAHALCMQTRGTVGGALP